MNRGSGLRVLFVDDEPQELEFLADFFRDDPGIEAFTESSADRALDRLATADVDCLVSDGVLTGDGEPLVEAASAAHPGLATVLYSGATAAETRTVAADASLRKGERRDRDTSLDALRATLFELVGSTGRGASAPADAGRDDEGEAWRSLGRFDWRSPDDVATTVVAALADALERESTDLGPLYYAVDPDALGRVLVDEGREPEASPVTVEFRFDDLLIRLSSTGRADYRPTDGTDRPRLSPR
jgi:CheY-like chemotaxis protein